MTGKSLNRRGVYDHENQVQVASGVETWVNAETGEAREFQTVEKRYYGQDQFWKMYLMDFLSVLGIIESKQLDVICYIMENTQPGNNLFVGTLDKIAEGAGVSRGTANTAVRKLIGARFMKRIQNGVYQINPSVLVKGSEKKKRSLVIEYNEVKAKEQEDEVRKAFESGSPAIIEAKVVEEE